MRKNPRVSASVLYDDLTDRGGSITTKVRGFLLYSPSKSEKKIVLAFCGSLTDSQKKKGTNPLTVNVYVEYIISPEDIDNDILRGKGINNLVCITE